MEKEIKINKHEEKILRVLLQSKFNLTTGAIAKESEMSWNTADKYMKRFKEKGWVKNRVGYWRAIMED